MPKQKIFRITTVPISLNKLLHGQLEYMQRFFDVTGISSDGPMLKEVEEKQGIKTVPLEMSRKITPLQDFRSILELYRILKKEQPSIVHTHTPKAGLVGMVAARFAGVPHCLHTVAGLPLMEARGIKRVVLESVERFIYSCAHQVFPNSKGLEQFILENNFAPKNKVKVIGGGSSNGINTQEFSRTQLSKQEQTKLKQEYNIQDNDLVFVFVGRLVGDKGINELVAAFYRLVKQQENIKLLLVGPQEPELDPLKPETIRLLNATSNIIEAGWQSDVRPFLALSDCLVFPSYREGFPNVVMQAGAMDLPSIVTNINGCNEIIIEGQNGTIIPSKDENALFVAMQKMVTKPNVRKQLAANSRKMIVDRYEQQYVWSELLKMYAGLEGVEIELPEEKRISPVVSENQQVS